MGIPSYFSYIIRNHPNIIASLEQLFKSPAFQYSSTAPSSSRDASSLPAVIKPGFQHLFFDANSIIYDAFHQIVAQHRSCAVSGIHETSVFFPLLTGRVIEMIEKHVHFIQPSETLFIAFDGLPPPAKIVQQKSRRFKTRHLESMVRNFQQQSPQHPPMQTSSTEFPWQTTMITPGTPFMNYLSEKLELHFQSNGKPRFQIPIQLLSTSTEPGEGEHKIFHYLRNHSPKITDKIALYGLDSDLIMLSLLSVPNIYIFREAPEFLASKIDDILQKVNPKHTFSHAHTHSKTHTNHPQPPEKEELPPYFLNINQLFNAIYESQMHTKLQPKIATNPVYDYVFMCFLLGNDFLPHIPALNLRSNGLNTLLKHYHQTRELPLQLINPATQEIQWKQLCKLLAPIAKEERELLVRENQSYRKMPKPSLFTEKMNDKSLPPMTATELQELFTAVPQHYTAAREYIRPEMERNWQERYRRVFPTACPLRFLKQMSDTWDYYLGRLSVLEHSTDSPPLLGDIVQVLQSTEFHPQQLDRIQPLEQLSFETNEDYLAYVLSEIPMKYDFTFSKMLWEVHVHG